MKASTSSLPGDVIRRTCVWPVRRPSRMTRLRRKPRWVLRSQASRPCWRQKARTCSRSSLMRSLAELAVGHRKDVVPAAGRVEAAHQLAVLAGPERELELVAVAPLLDGGDDRLQLEVLEPADALEGVGDLLGLDRELALVRDDLPRRARMVGELGDAVRRGLDDLDRPRLRVRLLGLADDGADLVARDAAGHEHDVALAAGDAVAAVGEGIDREFQHVAARRPGESCRGHEMCEDDRVSIDDPDELAALRAAGRVVAEAIREMSRRVRPGVTTAELDEVALQVFTRHGARSGAGADLRLSRHRLHLRRRRVRARHPGPAAAARGPAGQARRHRRARRLLRRRLPHGDRRPRPPARAAARRRRAVGAAARHRGRHGGPQRGRDRRAPCRPRSSAAASTSAPS